VALSAGTRLGPYEILSPLGAGGMGEVYRSRDTKLGRGVAIKVLPEKFFEDEDRIARFEREAKSLAAVSHPNIAALYSFEQISGRHLLVMELVEGETLADRLAKGPIPPGPIVKIGIEITSALDSAHRVGIVHRDLKPANVMLTRSGVKLLDFGLAKALAPENPADGLTSAPTTARDVTREGEIFGTLSYMAPEQLEGKKPDSRTDIFALGATLYEMATGRKAFPGTSQASVISAIMKEEPVPISGLESMTPPAFERVVRICLAKNPDDRWQSARDVGLQLRDMSAADARVSPQRPRKVRTALAAAALVLGATGLTALLSRRTQVAVEPVLFSVAPPGRALFESHPGDTIFSVSPDGRNLAFAAKNDAGQRVLWVRPIQSLTARPLPGTEGAAAPFWSPDSRLLGYFAGGRLEKIDAAGGVPLRICEAPGLFLTGSWSRKGEILFAKLVDGAIHRVAAVGGAPVAAVAADAEHQEGSICMPRFLPDSRHFLYVGRSSNSAQTYVRLGDLETGKSAVLVTDCSRAEFAPAAPEVPEGPGFLLFVRSGVLLAQPFDLAKLLTTGEPRPVVPEVMHHAFTGTGAFSSSGSGLLAWRSTRGPSQLQWVDRQGHPLGTEGRPGLYETIRLSPDGRKFAVSVLDLRPGTAGLWTADVGSGTLNRLTSGARDDIFPVWSPDGSRLVFSTGSPRGPPHIYESSLDGGEPKELTPLGSVQWVQDWSRDGRFVCYSESSLATQQDIWILDRSRPGRPAPFLATEFDEVEPQFSPDGRWIAYSSNESGTYEIYVVSFPNPGRKVRVSNAGGSRPRWRRDGKELFYVSGDNWMLSAPIRLGETAEVSAPQALFGISVVGWRDYDVSADGARFLIVVNTGEQLSRFISVTTNWLAALAEKR
jgi:Tol biopolymer transport system component